MNKFNKPVLLLITLGFLWGSGYSIARYAMTHGVPPLGYAFWQTWGPTLALLVFIYSKRIALKLSPKHLFYYFITGLTGIAIPNTTMYFAAAHLPAGILAIVVNTVPIIAYPLALSLQLEKFHWLRITGLIFGIAGIMLIVTHKLSLTHAQFANHWVLIALIAPFCFASCAIFISKYRPPNTDSACLSFGMLLFAALILTPLVFSMHQFYALTPPFHLAKFVVLLEIVLSSIGYILFFKLLKVAGPVYFSLVGGLTGLTGLFWGRIIFKEHITPIIAISVVCIILAITLITTKLDAYVKKPA